MTRALIYVLFVPPIVVAIAFSAPIYLVTFTLTSIATYFAGKSRQVTDPVAGISLPTTLPHAEFDRWANTVCSSSRYMQEYQVFISDPRRGFDEKLPVLMSQFKAINHWRAPKFLIFCLGAINTFVIYDLFYSDLTFTSPIATGLLTGTLYGYCAGVYSLWRACSDT